MSKIVIYDDAKRFAKLALLSALATLRIHVDEQIQIKMKIYFHNYKADVDRRWAKRVLCEMKVLNFHFHHFHSRHMDEFSARRCKAFQMTKNVDNFVKMFFILVSFFLYIFNWIFFKSYFFSWNLNSHFSENRFFVFCLIFSFLKANCVIRSELSATYFNWVSIISFLYD